LVETLIFWGLALVGAVTIVYLAAKGLQHRQHRANTPISVVFIVEDCEAQIEGLIRSLTVQFSLGAREASLHVLDLSTGDETGEIVARLALANPRITYRRLSSDHHLAEELERYNIDVQPVSVIYDLRREGAVDDVLKDMAAIL